jgi:integrase
LRGHQARPFGEAVVRAKITPPVSFHGLRHTYASLAIMAGMVPMVVAANLGHSDTRMVERHYGHLANKFKTEMIRATAPVFGLEPGNVERLGPGR